MAPRHGALDRTMPQGRKWKTGHLNMHKALGRSQLSKTDTGALKRNGSTKTRLVGRRPHTARHDAPDRTNMTHERKHKMGHPNVHKALEQSQLSKTDTGTLEKNGPNRMRLVGQPHMAQHRTSD